MKKLSFLIMVLAVCTQNAVWAEQNPLSLKTVLKRTQSNHPNLKYFKEKAAVIEANRLQAGLSPNPELSLSFENIFGSNETKGVGELEGTLLLSRLYERGNKKQRRVGVQDSKLMQFQAEYKLTQLDVFTSATEQYYQVARLQSLLELSQTQQNTVSHALISIKQRAKAGAVSNADVARMQLEYGTLKFEQQLLESEFTMAKQNLALFWLGKVDFHTVQTPSQYMDIHNRLDLTTLADLHNAIDTAPEIQLISQQVLSEQAMMQLITASATADITFGAGVRFDNASNSTSFLFDAAMPLQRSNSQIGNIKAAKAKVLLLIEQQQLLRKSLKHRITITYTQVQEQQQRLSQLQSQLLPLAKTLIEQSEESYRLGKISVLQLLDAQKERFSTERKIIETHSLLLKNRLTLQRLIGNTPLVTLNHESKNTLPLRLKSTTTTLASSLWSKTP